MPVDFRRLDRVLNPKTVAVVGDKKDSNFTWTHNFLPVMQLGGKLYSVQVDENQSAGIEKLGVKNYKSILDIPDQIDYVLVAVPRRVTPKVIEDCIKKGVAGVCMFTAGFAEADEEGRQIQNSIAEMARSAGMPLIGPNCMGVHNPRIGLRHNSDECFGESGNVSFIGQSGTHSSFFSLTAAAHGIKISKSISYGNGPVLDVYDYLEYLGNDPETKVIGTYIEGVRDGRKFFKVLREVASRKPVIVWKGGRTEAGFRAANSHTASLATAPALWDSMVKQAGAIRVENMDEMIDTVKALLWLKPPKGPRAALVCMTGGESVVITDTFQRAGLEVPLLSSKSFSELAEFCRPIGASFKNPLDVFANMVSKSLAIKTLNIVDADENIDFVVLEAFVAFLLKKWRPGEDGDKGFFEGVEEYSRTSQKPFFAVLTPTYTEKEAVDMRQYFHSHGILAFSTAARGAKACRNLLDYYQSRG